MHRHPRVNVLPLLCYDPAQQPSRGRDAVLGERCYGAAGAADDERRGAEGGRQDVEGHREGREGDQQQGLKVHTGLGLIEGTGPASVRAPCKVAATLGVNNKPFNTRRSYTPPGQKRIHSQPTAANALCVSPQCSPLLCANACFCHQSSSAPRDPTRPSSAFPGASRLRRPRPPRLPCGPPSPFLGRASPSGPSEDPIRSSHTISPPPPPSPPRLSSHLGPSPHPFPSRDPSPPTLSSCSQPRPASSPPEGAGRGATAVVVPDPSPLSDDCPGSLASLARNVISRACWAHFHSLNALSRVASPVASASRMSLASSASCSSLAADASLGMDSNSSRWYGATENVRPVLATWLQCRASAPVGVSSAQATRATSFTLLMAITYPQETARNVLPSTPRAHPTMRPLRRAIHVPASPPAMAEMAHWRTLRRSFSNTVPSA